jgi:hypothetical protein
VCSGGGGGGRGRGGRGGTGDCSQYSNTQRIGQFGVHTPVGTIFPPHPY